MKANELMIGDLFDVYRYECVADGGHFQEWKEYGKIVCINEDYVTVKYIAREEEYGFEYVEYPDLEPIPLTAEILEKNGFWCERNVGYVMEEDENEIIYSLWDNKLRVLKNREQILNLEYLDEMCVHEFQHALRLCNIEKEIKL